MLITYVRLATLALTIIFSSKFVHAQEVLWEALLDAQSQNHEFTAGTVLENGDIIAAGFNESGVNYSGALVARNITTGKVVMAESSTCTNEVYAFSVAEYKSNKIIVGSNQQSAIHLDISSKSGATTTIKILPRGDTALSGTVLKHIPNTDDVIIGGSASAPSHWKSFLARYTLSGELVWINYDINEFGTGFGNSFINNIQFLGDKILFQDTGREDLYRLDINTGERATPIKSPFPEDNRFLPKCLSVQNDTVWVAIMGPELQVWHVVGDTATAVLSRPEDDVTPRGSFLGNPINIKATSDEIIIHVNLFQEYRRIHLSIDGEDASYISMDDTDIRNPTRYGFSSRLINKSGNIVSLGFKSSTDTFNRAYAVEIDFSLEEPKNLYLSELSFPASGRHAIQKMDVQDGNTIIVYRKSEEFYLQKINKSGNIIFDSLLTNKTTRLSTCYGLEHFPNGNIALLLYYSTPSSLPEWKLELRYFDSAGKPILNTQLNTTDEVYFSIFDIGTRLSISTENILHTAFSQKNPSDPEVSESRVIRFDSNGELLSNQLIPLQTAKIINSITTSSNGSYILTAATKEPFYDPSAILKYDNTGQLEWKIESEINSSNFHPIFHEVFVLQDESIAILRYHDSKPNDFLIVSPDNTPQRILPFEASIFDLLGLYEDQVLFQERSSTTTEEGQAFYQSQINGFNMLTGETSEVFSSNSLKFFTFVTNLKIERDTIYSSGYFFNRDQGISYVKAEEFISEVQMQPRESQGELLIWPNPARGNDVFFDLNVPLVKWRVSDIAGREKLGTTLSCNGVQIQNLPTGLYFLTVQDVNGKFWTGKFLRQTTGTP